MKSRSHPKPPTGAEIEAAREIVQEFLCTDLDKDPVPPVMECWGGQGWHKNEIFLGIMIGLEIAKARRDRQEAR